MKEQLIFKDSAVYTTLKHFTDEANSLKRQAERYEQMNICLVTAIQNDIITDFEQFYCAISWFEHSKLEPWEIIKKINFMNKKVDK